MTWEATLLPVLLSAVVSAVVALVVSLSSAGVVVKVQRRAERSVEARRELRELVTPIRRKVAQYRADTRAGRKSDKRRAEDAALAARVLSVSEHLPWLRRWSIRRRVRRLVGPAWFDLAELHEPGNETEAFSAWLVAQVAAVRAERRGEHIDRADDLGLLHRALSGPRSSADLDQLERDLRRLSAGW